MRFLLTCLLEFTGFLCIEELLDVKLRDIKLQESHLEILIPNSKTDQHGGGDVVYISRIKSECCPVKYLEDHFLQKAKLDIYNDKESINSSRMLKTKSDHKISKTKGISYSRSWGNFVKTTYRRHSDTGQIWFTQS